MLKRYFRLFLVVFILGFVSVLLVYYYRSWYLGKMGTAVHPTQAIPLAQVPYYLQNDPAWADVPLGKSAYKMKGSGCLVCTITADLNHMGIAISPTEVNEKLSAAGAIDKNGDITFKKISKAFPQVGYYSKRDFGSATLQSELKQGKLPIVKVKYPGGDRPHWLLLLGSDKNDFWVMDPLERSRTPVKLSKYGKIYAYRVLYRKE